MQSERDYSSLRLNARSPVMMETRHHAAD